MLLPRSGKVALKWTFEKGSTLRYELTRSMQMAMGGREKNEQRTLFGLQMEITDVTDGVATIKVTYDRIKAAMSGMLESEYDSEKGDKPREQDVLAQVLGAMVGKSFEMKLEDTGRVREIKGCTDMLAAILKGIQDDSGLLSHLGEQFSDREVKAMMEMAFPRLHKEAVGEGGLWKDESTLSLHRLGEVTAKSKSKVLSVKGETVDWKTRTALENGEGVGDLHGRVEIWSADGDGKVTWDAGHGRLAEAKSETKIQAEAHAQEFEMVITSTMRLAPR